MKEISEFKYFLYKFLKLLIIVTIVFYINIYISVESKNIKSYTYNRTILYGFFAYILVGALPLSVIIIPLILHFRYHAFSNFSEIDESAEVPYLSEK